MTSYSNVASLVAIIIISYPNIPTVESNIKKTAISSFLNVFLKPVIIRNPIKEISSLIFSYDWYIKYYKYDLRMISKIIEKVYICLVI